MHCESFQLEKFTVSKGRSKVWGLILLGSSLFGMCVYRG